MVPQIKEIEYSVGSEDLWLISFYSGLRKTEKATLFHDAECNIDIYCFP